MANWGPEKMCPRSYKVGRLVGYGKHLVMACCSEAMPRWVSDSGQQETQRRSLRSSLSRRCSFLRDTVGGTCRHLSSKYKFDTVGHSWLVPCAIIPVPASRYTASFWPFCLESLLFLPKGQILISAFPSLLWARYARNTLFILRAKCFCRDNWKKLRMAHHDHLYHVYLRKFINSYYIREYVNEMCTHLA